MKPLPCILACALILREILPGWNNEARAQLPQDLCPPPAQWVARGGSFVCQCPNGSLLSLGQTCGMAPPQQVGAYCSNGGTCPVGSRCSWMVGRCVPNGKVDCGAYYCEPGNKCSSAGCIRAGAIDCANGSFCSEGQKCSQDGKRCLSASAIDCGTYACDAGEMCAPNGQCWPQGSIACGRSYCQRGFVCTTDNRCLTPAGLAADRAAQLDRSICADDASSVTDAVAACTRRITAGQLSGHDLAVAYFQRGNALKRRLDFDGALPDYDKAVTIDPMFAGGYVARGYARYNKDLIDEAMTDFEKAIQLEPANALAYNNLAWMLYRKHDHGRALIDANKALEIAPTLSIAFSTRGEIKRVRGDIEGAMSDLNLALASEPNSVFALVARGLAYRAKGDREKAVADLRQALALPATDVDRRLAHHMAEQALPDLIAEQQNPIRRWLSDVGLTRDRWPLAFGFVLVLSLAFALIALRKQVSTMVSSWTKPRLAQFELTSAIAAVEPIRQRVETIARPPAPAQAPQPTSMQGSTGGGSRASISEAAAKPLQSTDSFNPGTQAASTASQLKPLDTHKVGGVVAAIGGAGVVLCLVWWLIFYSAVVAKMGGRIDDAMVCLVYSTGPCYLIKTLASAAGYLAYEPIVFWIFAATAVGGLILLGSTGFSLDPKPQSPVEANIRKLPTYDQVKWKALVRFDPDIAAAAEKIQPLGQTYLDELAQAYFDLNDKNYLPKIVEKLMSDARSAKQS